MGIHKKNFSRRSGAQREELARALDFMREGDTLVVTKLDRLDRLDRLARSVRDLLDIVYTVEGMDANLRVLAMGLDTGGATGRMMLQVLGAVVEFERALMLERQREGIRKAQLAGKFRGRAPTARAKSREIKCMLASGVGASGFARRLVIARSSVYRIAKGG